MLMTTDYVELTDFPVWSVGELDTVTGVLSRAVAESPDELFLDFTGLTYTYDEVWQLARRRAAGLGDRGLGAGQTLICILDNNVEAVVNWFAANILGAVWVPVNTALKGEFLRHQIADAGAAIVIAEADYAQRVLDIADQLPELRQVIVRGDVAPPPTASVTTATLDAATADTAYDSAADVAPGDPAMLIYTSGTTGPSKGCVVSHNYVCNVARHTAATRDSTHLLWTPLPLFHLNAAGTSVLATAVNQSAVSIAPRFSLSGFWPDIQRSGAQEISILGVMIPLIATMDDTDEMTACYGQIESVGGAPWTPELIETWRHRFGVRTAGSAVFGLTEATFITSTPMDVDAPLGASGRLNDDFDVRIVDDNDIELPIGSPGEIILRPRKPHVMFSGYWRRPDATLASFANLWFHTGDIGRFDEDGWFWFVDRKKDYLRRRGENISSFEMESTFRAHPAIADVAVHAVPSEFSEDDVKVTAVLRDAAAVTEEELCRWSLDKLPYFAVPRYIEFRAELPRNQTGKVLKHQLRDEGVTPDTWDMESSDVRVAKR
jgi:crotonobetaine/carnitine-CoA ligase